MILTCPSCETRYNVKAGAIPEKGRTVRCAACGNKWHAVPEPDVTPDAPEEVAPEPQEAEVAPPVEPVIATDDASAEVEETPVVAAPVDDEVAQEIQQQAEAQVEAVEAVTEEPAPTTVPVEDDTHHDMDFTGFEEEEDEPGKSRTLTWILLALLVIASGAAAFAYLAPPEWRQQLGLAAAETGETPLEIVLTRNNRSTLESGNELVSVGGRIVNPTEGTEPVPPIRAELFDAEGQLVDSWTIQPPVQELGPGESASFNSAKDEAPANADEITLTLGG